MNIKSNSCEKICQYQHQGNERRIPKAIELCYHKLKMKKETETLNYKTDINKDK